MHTNETYFYSSLVLRFGFLGSKVQLLCSMTRWPNQWRRVLPRLVYLLQSFWSLSKSFVSLHLLKEIFALIEKRSALEALSPVLTNLDNILQNKSYQRAKIFNFSMCLYEKTFKSHHRKVILSYEAPFLSSCVLQRQSRSFIEQSSYWTLVLMQICGRPFPFLWDWPPQIWYSLYQDQILLRFIACFYCDLQNFLLIHVKS